MKEIIKNDGEKITYEVNGNFININDEFSINLAKMQRDYEVNIDIVRNSMGMLVTSVNQDLGNYVAQIFIPEKEYDFVASETLVDEDDNPLIEKVAKDFNIDDCTISLWGV